MKLVFALASVAGLALIVQAEPPKDHKPATPAAKAPDAKPETPSDDGMKEWLDANKPGAEHKECARAIGEWDMTTKMFNPADPSHPMESKGTEKVEWLIEGRYLKFETHGMMGPMPMIGYGISGYNNITKKYETTWVDNMSTGQMLYTGTKDEKGVIHLSCTYDDPRSGGKMESRIAEEWKDDNTHVMKFYEVMDGKEMMGMEITYTRKGTASTAKPLSTAPATHTAPTATPKNQNPEK